MIRHALLLALLALGCTPPTQHDPAYGIVRVYLDPAWLPVDRQRIRDELALLDALGPHFVEAGEGGRSTARVIVQPYDARQCSLGAGRAEIGGRIVEVDATCTPGDSAFRQAVGHEIGHALGLQHVCVRAGDAPDCSPVGYGPAMMNPALAGGGDSFDPALAEDAPTPLDLAEFRRVYGVLPRADGGVL